MDDQADEQQQAIGAGEADVPGGMAVEGTGLGGGAPATLPVEAMTDPGPVAQIAEWAGLGGPVVWILAIMSVVALAVSLMKLAQFLRQGVWARGPSRRAVAALREGKDPGTLAARLGRRSGLPELVVGQALAAVARHGPQAALREDVEQFASDRLEALRGNLRLLEVIAALAPLLGLFGTVLGMIAAFQQMEAAGARVSPDILSGGIWTALLTTAVGLAVAMPTVAVLTFFERALERLAHELDSLISQVFTSGAVAARETDEGGAHAGRSYGLARAS